MYCCTKIAILDIGMKKSCNNRVMGRDKKMTDTRGEAITRELEARPGLDRATLCKSYGVTLRTYQRWLAAQKVNTEDRHDR
jgi:hypothetical protein